MAAVELRCDTLARLQCSKRFGRFAKAQLHGCNALHSRKGAEPFMRAARLRGIAAAALHGAHTKIRVGWPHSFAALSTTMRAIRCKIAARQPSLQGNAPAQLHYSKAALPSCSKLQIKADTRHQQLRNLAGLCGCAECTAAVCARPRTSTTCGPNVCEVRMIAEPQAVRLNN